jgi:hypothetical protein
MKADSCAEITETKRIELKSGLAEPGEHPDSGFVVPAGILIGLGTGLIVDHPGSGFLAGLGLGLIGAELVARSRRSRETAYRQPGGLSLGRMNLTTLIAGAFLVFTGIWFAVSPAVTWPYALAGFLILAGILFLVRGFSAPA